MHAVKMEGAGRVVEVVRRLVEAGVPVMGHLGLTPQSVHAMGGYKVQGRGEEAAARILEEARALEEAGAFSVVLEGVPSGVGKAVTKALRIPTIGIGAGPHTDGQVLVTWDMLGASQKTPKFVKCYMNLREEMMGAVRAFKREVEAGEFPDEAHSYRDGVEEKD
jgi:3-methyl-2-oxobutanoate hydroxymethyltransferase